MPKSKAVEVEGSCGEMVTTKVWKQGHSIKCKRREATANRYWKPDKGRYWYGGNPLMSDIDAEVIDFCTTCSKKGWL